MIFLVKFFFLFRLFKSKNIKVYKKKEILDKPFIIAVFALCFLL